MDQMTGRRYHNSHDGFNGFMIYKILDSLVRLNNTSSEPYKYPGPEFRRLMTDFVDVLRKTSERMMAAVVGGGVPRLDIGVL